MIRAVIFDFNGVLVDDEAVHFALIRELVGELGITVTEQEYIDEYFGFDDRGCFTHALVSSGRPADEALIESLIARKAERYAAWADVSLRSFPGAAEAVCALAERFPLAICSGALRPEIEFALGKMAIAQHIQAIVSGEDVERCKPDPEGYFLALDALRAGECTGLEAGQCLVVEDSLAGVRAAKAAGMWTVGVTHSYPAHELRSAGVDAVVDEIGQLNPAWVQRLFHPEITP